MATPWNIRGSASQLFFQDKQSSQYKAFLAISHVPHPDRSILGDFINEAVDSEEAAQYLLRMTCADEQAPPKKTMSQFLSEWKALINKFRPTRATLLSDETRILIYKRDGGCCCLTRKAFQSYADRDLEYVQMVPPLAFSGPDFSEGNDNLDMLGAFLSSKLLGKWRLAFSGPESERLDNIWLLSTQAFNSIKAGQVFLRRRDWIKYPDDPEKQSYNVYPNPHSIDFRIYVSMFKDTIILGNRTSEPTPIINEDLLDIHARFSKPLAWMEIENRKNSPSYEPPYRKVLSWTKKIFSSLASPFLPILRQSLVLLPAFFRPFVYDVLIWVGSRMYFPSLSMTVYKLPFGLYLRRGSPKLASKYHAEAHTLRLVEKLTHIPAPRAIDVLKTPRFSYLLMTCVPGRPIGQVLDSMTDDELKQVVIDLKGYLAELRQIPNKTSEFQICNSEGGGILDWRIRDSQREELRFKTETEFNQYLTSRMAEEYRRRASISHNTRHEIVFTHGDLNLRNILAENGRITGIVDWENAGWFPEYWEYTKAHYTVRGVVHWLPDVVDRVFEGYRNELMVENMLSDLSGPF